jgi:hypothetical protein
VHAYLTRLRVRPEVQSFFEPFYSSDGTGNLVFNYRDSFEHFGFAFHRVPDSEQVWLAGNTNFQRVRQVFICSSAMDAIAFLNFHYTGFRHAGTLLFISVGTRANAEQLRWINTNLRGKQFTLVSGNDLLGRVGDLKTAAGIRRVPVAVSIDNEQVVIDFRHKVYSLPADAFTLNAFEKASGYRFNIRTSKSNNADGWFSWLKEKTFNPIT